MAADALKVTSTIPSVFITAGTPFTITTKIANAHDSPIRVLGIKFDIPYLVQWIHQQTYSQEFERRRTMPAPRRLAAGVPWAAALQPPGAPMIYRPDPDDETYQVPAGGSTSYSFNAVVPRWLFTTGSEVAFEGSVHYKLAEESLISSFSVRFLVKPPLVANIYGAIVGSILGGIAKVLKDMIADPGLVPDVSALAAIFLSLILAVTLVVFSSRRGADAQPVLTIEDFWGGMFAGFLVGYAGYGFFEEAVGLADGGGSG